MYENTDCREGLGSFIVSREGGRGGDGCKCLYEGAWGLDMDDG